MNKCRWTPSVLAWRIWSRQSDSSDMHRCTEQCRVHGLLQTATDSAYVGLEWQTGDCLLQNSTTDEHWKTTDQHAKLSRQRQLKHMHIKYTNEQNAHLHKSQKCLIEKVKARKFLHGKAISLLQGVACHMGSHNVTCHPTQANTTRLMHSQ